MIAAAVKKGLDVGGISLFQLNGEQAGQTVPHIHFHVLPGSVLAAKAHASISSETSDLEAIAAKIKAAL